MNIAISFGYSNKDTSIWDNDKIQNTLYLYLLLSKLDNVNVLLVNFGLHVNSLSEQSRFELGGIKLYNWLFIKDKIKIDIFIESGLKLNENDVNEIKRKKIKFILFNDYNKYLMDIEDILFNPNNNDILYDYYDEIWTLQSFQRMNRFYLEELYNTKVYELPNIWSSHFIDKYNKKLNNDYNFKIKDKNNIVIFQKNDNVNNTNIYPLLIIEKFYKENKELFNNKINKILLMNSNHLLNNKKFISILNKLEIYKNNFIIIKNKELLPYTLSESTDIIISHQWDNSIDNYFFDALYGNYPIIHNSDNFKTNGYYYQDFNIQLASDKLKYLLLNHNKLINKHKDRNIGILNNYNINNKNIQKIYHDKIFNIN